MKLEDYAKIRKDFVALANLSYKYYRSTLSKNEQKVYDAMFKAVLDFKTSVEIKNHSLSSNRLFEVFTCVKNDNPWFFFVEGSLNYTLSGNDCICRFTYNMDPQKILDVTHLILKKLYVYQVACSKKNNSEKILYVHNKIVADTTYTFDVKDPYSAHSVLLLGKGVCAGYANALKLVLDALSVHTIYVTGRIVGEGDGGHAWNMVDIGGDNFYHVDVTFDDGMQQDNIVSYNEFILTDAQMRKTHIFDLGKLKTPAIEVDFFALIGRSYADYNSFKMGLKEAITNKERVFGCKFKGSLYCSGVAGMLGEIINELIYEYGCALQEWKYYLIEERNTMYLIFKY